MTFKAQVPKLGRVGSSMILSVVAGVFLFFTVMGDGLQRLSYDIPLRVLPRTEVDGLVIVRMDEESRRQFGQTADRKWNRSIHSALLKKLKEDGARIVAFDVFFDDIDFSTADEDFIATIANYPKVVLAGISDRIELLDKGTTNAPAIKIEGRSTISSALLAAVQSRWGVSSILTDDDTRVRRHWEQEGHPSLPWAAAEAADAKITRNPKDRIQNRWIRYYGPAQTLASVAYYQATNLAKGYFTDKAVFIGGPPEPQLPGAKSDVFGTPLGRMPGVEIVASIYLNLVRGDWLRKMSQGPELLLVLVAGVTFGLGFSKLRPLSGFLWGCLVALLIAGTAVWLVHAQNLWFNWVLIAAVQLPLAYVISAVLYTEDIVKNYETIKKHLETMSKSGESSREDRGPNGPPSPPLPPGDSHVAPVRIPNFDLLKYIGGGAFGEVWLAKTVTGIFRSIKIVSRKNFSDVAPYNREFRGLVEFAPISEDHPGWMRIYHVGTDEQAGCFYYVMEIADDTEKGREIDPLLYSPKTLGTLLTERETLSIRECTELGISLADALGALHERGLIHRDVKPSNVIYVLDRPKLADIGLVSRISPHGSLVGTLGYMPEKGLRTASADIFALGRVLYQAATGCPPERHPGLPTALDERTDGRDLMRLMTIINKACENEVEDRYQSAAEFKLDLEKLLTRLAAKRS
jgi:CHASE2 domain-containing sensor protein